MRIASIGDSFTEGVGDDLPHGGVRGWADLVAAGLAAGLDEPVEYVNVAIRGRLIEPIVHEQLEHVLGLDPLPTVVTFNGGGNDMMRPGFDLDRIMELIEMSIDRCDAAGVELLLLSGGDPTARLPRGAMMSQRGKIYLDAVAELLERRPDQPFVDNWSDTELARAPYWSADRLHLNALGHSRVAARVLTHLGVETALPAADGEEVVATGALAEARYYATYVLPWLGRRLTRRSSGDGREPKHPTWTRITPLT
ncbi:SGNH/GDSL hydrolase family protein [Demequina sp. B12]|uniref:SGNH/GDSL hydrolase family protein n=1 Tax=Demequina sp. B12 TaxID=2992757 RepID=UPI00237A19BC|nr:SGNH/GDSL hydrolase family protein [Demequina sp. B12]MDE0572801.1 SGNH/GDSL hydrolase family protein [Demequina sp. B12]